MELLDRWQDLKQTLPSHIALMIVTKGQSIQQVQPLFEAGQRLFGENRLQEMLLKWPVLRQSFQDLELHFIGQLQTNKVIAVLQLCDAIQSVDRPRLVNALVAQRSYWRPGFRIYIQVNLGGETQKGGVSLEGFEELLQLCRAKALPVCGVMTVPPIDKEPTPYFQELKNLAHKHHLSEISMGMSGDYQKAVANGSTLVRIGTALFEKRS